MPEPGSPEWHARIASLLAAEAAEPEGWWYLSFAKPGKFLGGAFVYARGFTSAWQKTHQLKINPGGQVAHYQLPPDAGSKIPKNMRNRLLTKAEVENLGRPN